MITTVKNGKTYKIQFVHSSHDGLTQQNATPGGLRQFIDNLAASLNRRVSFAELCEVTDSEPVENGEISRIFTPISQGFTVCNREDQFKKSEGRRWALDRVLMLSGLKYDVQTELWNASWSVPTERPSEQF